MTHAACSTSALQFVRVTSKSIHSLCGRSLSILKYAFPAPFPVLLCFVEYALMMIYGIKMFLQNFSSLIKHLRYSNERRMLMVFFVRFFISTRNGKYKNFFVLSSTLESRVLDSKNKSNVQ